MGGGEKENKLAWPHMESISNGPINMGDSFLHSVRRGTCLVRAIPSDQVGSQVPGHDTDLFVLFLHLKECRMVPDLLSPLVRWSGGENQKRGSPGYREMCRTPSIPVM